MNPTTLLGALLIAALPGLAYAAAQDKDIDSTKRIDQRQDSQDKRIDSSAKSGDITKKEAKRLESRQDRIDAAEKKAMKDKKMTKEERARIEKMQDRQARDIKRQSSDKQERGATARQSASASQREKDLAYLEAEEKKAMADGVLSPRERIHIGNIRARLGLEPLEKERRDRE